MRHFGIKVGSCVYSLLFIFYPRYFSVVKYTFWKPDFYFCKTFYSMDVPFPFFNSINHLVANTIRVSTMVFHLCVCSNCSMRWHSLTWNYWMKVYTISNVSNCPPETWWQWRLSPAASEITFISYRNVQSFLIDL